MSDLLQLELFPESCVPAAARSEGSSLGAYIRALSSRARPFLVVDNTFRVSLSRCQLRQLTLDLHSGQDSIVRLVPKTLSAFLGMPTTSFFRRCPALYRVALQFQRRGVIFVGDFLRLPASEILGSLKSPEAQHLLEEQLARVGLSLGGWFSWWKRPVVP